MLDESLLLIIGVMLIAFLFAPLGLGGGLLYVPLFHYVGGWEIDQKLIIASLFLTAITSIGSGLQHRKNQHFDDELSGVALRGAIPGALIGVLFVLMTQTQFNRFFKILSVFIIGFVIFKMKNRIHGKQRLEINYLRQPRKLAIFSTLGGFLSSVMAVGAGIIYVPAMKIFGNLTTRKAIGSSYNVMIIVVPFAMLAHYFMLEDYQKSDLQNNWILLAILASVNFIGAKLGALVGFKLFNEAILLKIFIGVLSITWVNYIIDLLV